MYFRNRKEAGQRLAELFIDLKNKSDVIVIGLPRGGVPVAYELAQYLKAPLDIIVTRKIGAPQNEEAAIGAVTDTGASFLDQQMISLISVSEDYINNMIKKKTEEARRRIDLYRNKHPPLEVADKTIILVDDGIATGSTMKAAVFSAKEKGAKKCIVASPVAAPDAILRIKEKDSGVEDIRTLYTPPTFVAVGEWYVEFDQVSDQEVIDFLNK